MTLADPEWPCQQDAQIIVWVCGSASGRPQPVDDSRTTDSRPATSHSMDVACTTVISPYSFRENYKGASLCTMPPTGAHSWLSRSTAESNIVGPWNPFSCLVKTQHARVFRPTLHGIQLLAGLHEYWIPVSAKSNYLFMSGATYLQA